MRRAVGSRLHLIGGLALAMAVTCGAQARDFEMGDDNDYLYSIMTPEPGTAGHHRATAPRRVRHGETSQRPVISPAKRSSNLFTTRGSSGSVLPTPLPRTQLIPPEGGGFPIARALPQEQGPTVVPGLTNPVPNLPHGPETFQDRASRCGMQQGLNGVPPTASSQYMHACAM
jgi:hypothetical protein